MKFILIMIAIILILIIIIFFTGLIIYKKMQKNLGKSEFKSLLNVIKNAKQLQAEEYSRPKDIQGMTRLVEPQILEDFPDFNKEVLFSQLETNLRKIFNSFENKSIDIISKDSELVMIRENIKEKIEDLSSRNINVKYDDIKFNRHALKSYLKSKSMYTIEISTTLEYYYKEFSNEDFEKPLNKFYDIKKQTRYTSKFAYIYDETDFKKGKTTFIISCPNCGAPLKNIKERTCEYCGSYNEPINLKTWKMISFVEDYK